MADFLANLPIDHPALWLGVALVLLAAGFLGGRLGAKRSASSSITPFGNDTAVLNLVVEHAHEGLVMQDIYGHIEWSNPAYTRITGFSADEIRGRRPQEFILAPENQIPAEEIETFKYDLSKFQSGVHELILNRRKNGDLFWNQLTFAVVAGETEDDTKIILICRDVTSHVEHVKELEQARNRLKYQAEHDDLTGVANRARISDYLQEKVSESAGKSGQIGIIHVDLDHFKDINDNHGHGAGDAVLRQVAKTLQSVLGPEGLVARVGGDEFIAVVPEPTGAEQMEHLGAEILRGLATPVTVDQHRLRVAGSAGLVLADPAEASVSELINRADIALYAAKKSGRNRFAWYTEAIGTAHRQRRMVLARLDQDLETGDLSLLMEPQYSLQDQQIIGYEVFTRWLHPTDGLVDPIKLLSRHEDANRIAQIELFALRRGLSEVKRLREASNIPFFLSVNLTDASLKQPGVMDAVRQMSEETAIPTSDIIVELDEKIIRFDEPDGLVGVMGDLSETGCKVAVDEFGGGHGGAGQLIRLEADMLKICPELVTGMEEQDNMRQLVQSVIRLAGNLGLEACATGVDRPEQLETLKEFGCLRIQGNMVSAPMSPREAELHMRAFDLENGRLLDGRVQ